MLQFLGPIANLAGTWLQNKVEKTKADGQAKVAEAKLVQQLQRKLRRVKLSGKAKWQRLQIIVGRTNSL